MSESEPKVAPDLNLLMETSMQDLQSRFQTLTDQIGSRKMGSRIDGLEQNVSALMTQGGKENDQTIKVSAQEERSNPDAS